MAADTFLRVQRWEGGKWLAFPLPTKTDQSGQFTAYVEFGQPGRYQLRILDPGSGVTSNLCASDQGLSVSGHQPSMLLAGISASRHGI